MDEKTTKGPSSQMSASAIRSGIDQKLHRLARPMHLGVLASVERPRDAEAEAGDQSPADAESGGLRLGGQRDQVRSPNQEVLDQRGQDLSWRINR